MRQALRIFCKDARQFWIEIVVVLVPMFCFPSSNSHTLGTLGLTLLLPLACLFLIMRVFHGDAIPGDRQFWVTRPYDRKSLLAAKTMFIIAFVNLPLIIMQAVILASHDFPVAANLSGLLWEQFLLSVAIFLPAAAMASITATTAQFFLSFLAFFLLCSSAALCTPRQGMDRWARSNGSAITPESARFSWLESRSCCCSSCVEEPPSLDN